VKEESWDNCDRATGKQDRLAFESHNNPERAPSRREALIGLKRILVSRRVFLAGFGISRFPGSFKCRWPWLWANAGAFSANKTSPTNDAEIRRAIARDRLT
jgi:hypothetical protein